MTAKNRILPLVLLAGLAVAGGPTLAAAQTVVSRQSNSDETQAQQVRGEFMAVLGQYPPAVGAVLKLDPSLVASDPYLAPYPALTAFLAKHPEIRRSPAYYLEQVRTSTGNDYGSYYYDPRTRAWDSMMEMMAVLVVILTIVGTLGWLIRTAVDYRRWGRLAKVQAEAHTKLLDRFTGNDELLAYVQSSAGARFLKSSPISLDGTPRQMGAPLSRILWSMQVGVVLAAAGIGMNYVSRHVDPNRADPIFTLSVILLSLGIGFFASSGLSYAMSRRMGLLEPATPRDAED